MILVFHDIDTIKPGCVELLVETFSQLQSLRKYTKFFFFACWIYVCLWWHALVYHLVQATSSDPSQSIVQTCSGAGVSERSGLVEHGTTFPSLKSNSLRALSHSGTWKQEHFSNPCTETDVPCHSAVLAFNAQPSLRNSALVDSREYACSKLQSICWRLVWRMPVSDWTPSRFFFVSFSLWPADSSESPPSRPPCSLRMRAGSTQVAPLRRMICCPSTGSGATQVSFTARQGPLHLYILMNNRESCVMRNSGVGPIREVLIMGSRTFWFRAPWRVTTGSCPHLQAACSREVLSVRNTVTTEIRPGQLTTETAFFIRTTNGKFEECVFSNQLNSECKRSKHDARCFQSNVKSNCEYTALSLRPRSR